MVLDRIEPLSYLGNHKSNCSKVGVTLPLRPRIYLAVRMEKNKKALDSFVKFVILYNIR